LADVVIKDNDSHLTGHVIAVRIIETLIDRGAGIDA
jgi:hypothetical protein